MFISYFSQRKHLVNMLEVSSPTSFIVIGTAQGSCLGPLMFIIYMNDHFRFSNEVNLLRYADDTTLYLPGVDIDQCTSIMNQ